MARYQRGDEVYAIDQIDTRIAIVDPDGTKRFEDCANVAIARTRYRVLVNQKLRDGWKLVVAAPEPPAPPGPPERVVENARNEELEAALLADPENEAAWLVYGDWLQQQGDPRGTYIALRTAARDKDPLAVDRLLRHDGRYRDYLRGGLSISADIGWGFVERVDVMKPAELEALIAKPAGRFVLKVDIPWAARKVAEIIAVCARISTLRELSIIKGKSIETFAPLDLDRLRLLHVGGELRLRCIDEIAAAKNLRVLGLETAGDWLGRAAFAPHLEKLVLPNLSDGDARELLRHLEADRFPALAELQIPEISLDLYRRLAAIIPQMGEPRGRFARITE